MVLIQMNPQTGRQQRENFTKPKWKNYDFTMFWSRITISRCIAVKWYLRVYWLLPLSIVDSFKKHRRFFRRAPTILLLSTVDSFAEHRRFFCQEPTILLLSTDESFAEHHEYLGQSINFISQRSLFLISTDSFSLHQLNQQTAWQKSYWINRHRLQDPPAFVDKTVMPNSRVLLGHAKICACTVGEQALMRRSLSPDWHPARKETIAGFTLSVTFRPTKKYYCPWSWLKYPNIHGRKWKPDW